MWKKGSLKIENEIFTYCAKVYEEPSEGYGLEKSRISKLEIRKDGRPVASYERGWEIKPETENSQLAVAAILQSLG